MSRKLEIDKISKRYGQVVALREMTFDSFDSKGRNAAPHERDMLQRTVRVATEFARSPRGQRLLHNAQRYAERPENQRRLAQVRRWLVSRRKRRS